MTQKAGAHQRQRSAMRRAKAASCIQLLRDGGVATVSELMDKTGLSRPTVDSILGSLDTIGLVRELPAQVVDERTGGRPARRFAFQAGHRHLASIDLGLHSMTALIGDLGGRIVAVKRSVTPVHAGASELLECADSLLTSLLEENNRTRSDLHATCVQISGAIAPDGRIRRSNAIPEWNGHDLGGTFSELFGCFAIVENDVKAAALAEHHLGEGRSSSDIAYIHAGHRMTAAVIIDGEIHRGRHGVSGELGMLTHVGWRGADHVDGISSMLFDGRSSEEVLGAALVGDLDAQARWQQLVDRLAYGVVTLVLTMDPDLVVIGGGMSRAGATLLMPLVAKVNEELGGLVDLPIRLSDLGAEATVYGGYLRALTYAAESLYGDPTLPLPGISLSI